MLWLALTANKFAVRPSELLEIERDGGTAALDLDLACAMRLMEHENKRDFKRLESLVKSLMAGAVSLFGGDPASILNADSDSENTDEISEATGPNDPFYQRMMAEAGQQ